MKFPEWSEERLKSMADAEDAAGNINIGCIEDVITEARLKELLTYLEINDKVRSKNGVPTGVTPPEKFLLKYGETWPIDDDTFNIVLPVKQCFKNAAELAIANPGLTYCEGYCNTGLLPIEHAWCVTHDGFVVEPTLREQNCAGPPAYWGVAFKTSFLTTCVLRNKVYGLLTFENRDIYEMTDKVLRRKALK